MSTSNRIPAFLAYLLLIIGWLYVFLFYRNDKLAMYHTKQSIMLTIIAIGLPLVWAIGGWLLSLIPFGIIIAASIFALVIVAEIAILAIWVVGMVYAWQAKIKPIPIVGRWAEQLFRV